ncbi:MAG: hypothetical protein QOG49_1027, partial [Frankiaceae bacterium]|nr:hypothetical protein [Frankiaceae bacterium]
MAAARDNAPFKGGLSRFAADRRDVAWSSQSTDLGWLHMRRQL